MDEGTGKWDDGAWQKKRPDVGSLKTPPEGNRRIPGMGCREVEVTYRGLNFSLDETRLGLRAARLVCCSVYCAMGCRGFPLPAFVGACALDNPLFAKLFDYPCFCLELRVSSSEIRDC